MKEKQLKKAFALKVFHPLKKQNLRYISHLFKINININNNEGTVKLQFHLKIWYCMATKA